MSAARSRSAATGCVAACANKGVMAQQHTCRQRRTKCVNEGMLRIQTYTSVFKNWLNVLVRCFRFRFYVLLGARSEKVRKHILLDHRAKLS